MMPWSRHLSRLALVLGGSLLLAVAACAPLPSGPQRAPIEDRHGAGLLERWQQRSAGFSSIQGIAAARVETAEGSVSGTQVLLAERPDHFRAESLSPFGTALLTLAADGDRLGAYLPTRNVFYAGAATAENLGRFTRLPLAPADLVDLLLYRPPLAAKSVAAAYALGNGGWQLVLTNGDRQQELFFDRAEHLVRVTYSTGGRLLLEVDYAGFGVPAEGFPSEFAIHVPEFATRARLEFSELALNRSFQPGIFHLVPPEGTRIYQLEPN